MGDFQWEHTDKWGGLYNQLIFFPGVSVRFRFT